MGDNANKFFTATAILVGTCIGAGVLGIPYVASRAGFFAALGYIIFLGLLIMLVNLYLGEISLRTKQTHQITGYAGKYLGRNGKRIITFAVIFGIYSAIIAYILGVGESLSFLIFENSSYSIYLGIFFGVVMSGLIWRGMRELKRFEKIGVSIVLLLLLAIFFIFVRDVNFNNLTYINSGNIFLPFGVVLFALLCFSAVPEVRMVLHKNEKMMKKAIIVSSLISIIFYSLFAFVVVGFKGLETPQIATLALGSVFVLLGIFTMFTSYLALGNALMESLMFDQRLKKRSAWFLSSVIPVILFFLIKFFNIFSFVGILSIGGVISGGITIIAILFMVKKAKRKGDRKPEYSISINWFVVGILSLIFILGIVWEIL